MESISWLNLTSGKNQQDTKYIHRRGETQIKLSLTGTNHGFWFHFGCSGEKSPISLPVDLFYSVANEEILKNRHHCILFEVD